jgi:hypothetical protein
MPPAGRDATRAVNGYWYAVFAIHKGGTSGGQRELTRLNAIPQLFFGWGYSLMSNRGSAVFLVNMKALRRELAICLGARR